LKDLTISFQILLFVNAPRKTGGLNFRPSAEKTKAQACFNRCICYRMQRTRFLEKSFLESKNDPWKRNAIVLKLHFGI